MPTCEGCGLEMKEVSRKIIKGEAATGRPNYKAVYRCENKVCAKKGVGKGFLDDGLLFIPLPDVP
jgi:hypothetical protein